MTGFPSKRNMIFRDLARRPLTVKELSKKFGIAPATARKHISLLRNEGRRIAYDPSDKRYYTPQATDREQRIKKSIARLAKDWNPQSVWDPEHACAGKDELETRISKIFRELSDKLHQVEERASELVLRVLLLNTDIADRCTAVAIASYLGLEEDVVKGTLEMLAKRTVVSEMPTCNGKVWYRIVDERAFIVAMRERLLSLTPAEVLEILEIRESDRKGFSTKGAAVWAWALDQEGSTKIRWIPGMVYDYFMPGLARAFADAISQPHPTTKERVGEDRSTDLMPAIVERLQKTSGPGDEVLGPEWSLVDRLLHLAIGQDLSKPRLDPFLWCTLGFRDDPPEGDVRKAQKKLKEAEMKYLLAYYRRLWDALKEKGMIQLLRAYSTPGRAAKKAWETAGGGVGQGPLEWVFPCFLAMLSAVFRHAETVASSCQLEPSIISRLGQYRDVFGDAARYGEQP